VLETGFFAFKHVIMNRWSDLRERMLSHAQSNKQYRFEAALFTYLIPCYLAAFVECNNGEGEGVVFFGRVLQLLLSKSSSMLGENQPQEPLEATVRNTADLIAQLWTLQNKVLLLYYLNLF
jgi:hypothetical protein